MNLFEFEKKYKDILEDIEEWVYFRIILGHKLKKSTKSQNIIKENGRKIADKFKKFKNIFYGFKNWFKSYDYIFFSSTDQRKNIDGKYTDKLCDPIIKELKNSGYKSLMVERANPKRYKNIATQYVGAIEYIEAFAYLLKIILMPINNLLVKNRDKFINLEKIDELKKYNIDYNSAVYHFHIAKIIYEIFFYIYKPKAIFIVCGYCNFPIVYVAKKRGIKVIEIQHGVINSVHFGYISEINLNNTYIPDILLSFGKNETYLKNNIIKKVIPVGSYLLEYLNKNFKTDKKLNNIVSQYSYSVGVSMQDDDWEFYGGIEFIKDLASLNEDILYILIPRKRTLKDISLPKNVICFNEIDCYNIILHCDIHSTLYSSCALEAPSLGIPNILININNFSKKYYEGLLSDLSTAIVDFKADFINNIYKFKNIDKDLVKESNKNIFVTNYTFNIENFIKNEIIEKAKFHKTI